MHTTNQLLDLLARKYATPKGPATDYRLGKMLNTSSASTVTNWRSGRSALSQNYAVRVAELLECDPAYVIACVEHERAEKDARLESTGEILTTWQRIAEKFRPAALPSILLAMIAAGIADFSLTDQISAAGYSSSLFFTPFTYYAQYAGYILLAGTALAYTYRRWYFITEFPAHTPISALA